MIEVRELKQWLATLDDEDMVAIDEGGLTLEVVFIASLGNLGAYIEIGGKPDEDEDEDEDRFSESAFKEDQRNRF